MPSAKLLHKLGRGNIYTEISHRKALRTQQRPEDVFSNVVNVALDSAQSHLPGLISGRLLRQYRLHDLHDFAEDLPGIIMLEM